MKYTETCWREIPCLSLYFQFATVSSEFHPLWSAQPVMIQNGRRACMLHCFLCIRWPGCSSSIQFKFYAAMQLLMSVMGFHGGSAVKNLPAMQETQVWSLSWEDPLRRAWQPTPVFLPGEFHGQRSLVGSGPQGCTETDMIETTKQKQQYLLYSCRSDFRMAQAFRICTFSQQSIWRLRK